MMHIPQLRIRTGYSFRDCYGQISDIAARLKEIGAESAAAVDNSTWSHVTWEKELTKAGIAPMFGMEVPIFERDEEGEVKPFKPRAWMLAADTRAFYNATTQSVQNKGMTRAEFGAMQGAFSKEEAKVFKFSGGALDALQYGDYDFIDLNPSSITLAHRGVHHHRLTGISLVITSYNDMPTPEDARYAHGWEVRDSVGMRHIATVDEIWSKLQLVMTRKEFDDACENTIEVAARLKDVRLQKAPVISVPGDIMALCRAGVYERCLSGRIPEWTQAYEDRLIEEIRQIQLKGFDSYFVVVADLIAYAKKHMFVGPARGSAAGSLVCFLMGITEIDPLPYNLLFQRFIDISREDFPDIDIDFSDSKRFMVFDYLREKYGNSHVSKVGNVSTLQPKSVLPQVGKKFKLPASDSFAIHNVLFKYLDGDPRYGHALEDTFSKTGPGQLFKERNPEAARIMERIETHPSHTSVHAGGVLVCNDPISDFCTLTEEGVAQLDKIDAEYLNLLKIDALGLRTLGILEDTSVIDSATLYGLRFDDPEVLAIIGNDQVSGVFQFEGAAVRAATKQIEDFNRFDQIVNLTALARPGPMGSGMDKSYINRANGKEKVTYDFPQLEGHLKDTFGVIVYQEQLMSIIREIGGFDWAKTSAVRKGMAKSKGEEYLNQWRPDFISGAIANGVDEDDAAKLWKEMSTFGAYGFNKCISGDTKVLLAYSNQSVGKTPTIAQLYDMYIRNPGKSLRDKMRKKKCMPVLLCLNEDDGLAYPVMAENIHFNGVKPCVNLKFSDGSEVVCTKDHKFIINGEWKICGDARIGSLFTTIQNANGKVASKSRSLLPGSKGWAKGMSWTDGKRMELNGKTREETIFKEANKDKPCEDCNLIKARMEAHHNDFDAGKIRPEDFAWLCNGCHKKRHFANGDRKKAYQKGQPIGAPLVLIGVEDAGEVETYDIEMPDPWHNFKLGNGIVTHNSHSVAYAAVTYWTCYMKRYHRLEFAAACLRAAKDDDQTIAILRELAAEGVSYTPIDPDYSEMNWKVADGRLIGGIMNAKGYGAVKAAAYVEKRNAGLLTQKDKDRLANSQVNFGDLREAHTKWGHFYDNPRLANVLTGEPILGMKEVADRKEAVIIAKLGSKKVQDERSADRTKKRGKAWGDGPSEFVDLFMADDSADTPMRFRVKPENFELFGRPLLDDPKGTWYLVRAWKLPEIDMMIVKRIKRLDEASV